MKLLVTDKSSNLNWRNQSVSLRVQKAVNISVLQNYKNLV